MASGGSVGVNQTLLCQPRAVCFGTIKAENDFLTIHVSACILITSSSLYKRGGFSCLKDRMLEKFQPIKIAKRYYWLNAFLTKSKSILTEKVLNQ